MVIADQALIDRRLIPTFLHRTLLKITSRCLVNIPSPQKHCHSVSSNGVIINETPIYRGFVLFIVFTVPTSQDLLYITGCIDLIGFIQNIIKIFRYNIQFLKTLYSVFTDEIDLINNRLKTPTNRGIVLFIAFAG